MKDMILLLIPLLPLALTTSVLILAFSFRQYEIARNLRYQNQTIQTNQTNQTTNTNQTMNNVHSEQNTEQTQQVDPPLPKEFDDMMQIIKDFQGVPNQNPQTNQSIQTKEVSHAD